MITINYDTLESLLVRYQETHEQKLTRAEVKLIDTVLFELAGMSDNGWIPFAKRPLTEDEQKNHPELCYILDGDVPEDGQEILLYRPWRNAEGYIIEMDRYCNNGDECYLEGAGDIENGMYWMPLPEAPKEDTP